MRSAAELANERLVEQLVARGALWSARLIATFRATPRHRFLEHVFHYRRKAGGWREVDTRAPGKAELRLLYSDRALTTRLSGSAPGRPQVPISSSSQPSLMAQMLEDLRLAPGQRVLEVGAGTGYNAALVAHVTGRVLSVEVDRRVLAEAEEHLLAFPDRAVTFRHADGREGWPGAAPYDRLIVTAATPDLEPAWLEQLAEGGVLLAPLELAPGLSYLVRGGMNGGVFEGRLTRPAYFMPLRAEGETGRDGTGEGGLPPPEGLREVAAPWADWAERRPAVNGPGFLQSLAFLAWLEGLAVSYAVLPDGRPSYGVCDRVRGHGCWLGAKGWRVTGAAGRGLGRRLWRQFLEWGGPWPTELRLRAYPPGVAPEEPPGPRGFVRQGPRCTQVWEMIEPRERGG